MAFPAISQRSATRVLLVGKSAVAMSILEAILSVEEEFHVVAVKRSMPEDVTTLLKLTRPDVVLIDASRVDGFCMKSVSEFSKAGSVPVVAIAPLASKKEVERKLIPLGVLGVIPRPRSSSEGLYQFAARLKHLLKTKGQKQEFRGKPRRIPIIVIASSAGGPSTLRYLLERLPLDVPAAIIVVQHINQVFFDGFVRWLEGVTAWDLVIPREGEVLSIGKVYLIPPTMDIEVDAEGRFHEIPLKEERGGVRPSVDDVLRVLSRHHAGNTIAVILTGIGDDGTAGAQELRKAGGYVIAESEKDSLVFGMPKSVIEAGAANEVLSLSQMPRRLMELVERMSKGETPGVNPWRRRED